MEPQLLREIGELAVTRAVDIDELRAALLQRRGKVAVSLNRESIDEVGLLRRAEIQWQDRLTNQVAVSTDEETRSLGGWVKTYLAKEQRRVTARELSPGRFSSARASLFFFRDWAGAQIEVAAIAGQMLTRYHSHLLDLVASDSCSATYAGDRLVVVRSFIRCHVEMSICCRASTRTLLRNFKWGICWCSH